MKSPRELRHRREWRFRLVKAIISLEPPDLEFFYGELSELGGS